MKSLILLCGLLVAGAVPASAQVNTLVEDNPREEARLKLGPLYATPRIQLSELGWDTNVFNESGGRETDFTFTLSPGADVWVPFARRALLKTTVASDLVWYHEFEGERSIDPSLTTRGEVYLRRFTPFVEHSVLTSRQRPSLEIDLRSRRVENELTLGVDMRLTPTFSVEVHGKKSSVEFDGDAFFLGSKLEETLNRDSNGIGVAGRYRRTVLTTFVVRTERFEERFPLSPERGSDNVRVMGGVEFHPRALVSGSAFVGARHLNPVDEALLPEFTGLVSQISLSYTLLGSTTFSLSHARDLNYSFEPLQPYYVATSVGASVRRAIGARFDVVVSAGRHTYTYRDLLAQPMPAAARRIDTIWNYGGSFGYRFGRDGRIGLGATYWRRDSTTIATREYDGLRIGTSATYGF